MHAATFVHSATRMIAAACLLARCEGLALIRRDHGVSLLHGLFANLARLLISLLRRKRSVGTGGFDLRACIARNGMHLLHHRFFNARLLEAGFPTTAARMPILR